jgi:hypothetical protein
MSGEVNSNRKGNEAAAAAAPLASAPLASAPLASAPLLLLPLLLLPLLLLLLLLSLLQLAHAAAAAWRSDAHHLGSLPTLWNRIPVMKCAARVRFCVCACCVSRVGVGWTPSGTTCGTQTKNQ